MDCSDEGGVNMPLRLPERVQASQVEQLLTQFRDLKEDSPVIDVTDVTKVDTSGVQLLLCLARSRPTMRFVGTSPALKCAVQSLGLGKHFAFEEDT